MNRYEVRFKYADSLSNWDWRSQQCILYANDEEEAKQKCRQLYGLGIDCDYEITDIIRL